MSNMYILTAQIKGIRRLLDLNSTSKTYGSIAKI